MPFYFWLPFLLLDLYTPVTDEYYMQFGVGPGYQRTLYRLEDGSTGTLNDIGPSGTARIGIMATPQLGLYMATSGGALGGVATTHDLVSSVYSGPVEHTLIGLGLGAHYQVRDFRIGAGVHSAWAGIEIAEGEREGEKIHEREGVAGELFAEYIFAQNALAEESWQDRIKYRATVSLNALVHQDGSANVALLLNGSVGYAPLRAQKKAAP